LDVSQLRLCFAHQLPVVSLSVFVISPSLLWWYWVILQVAMCSLLYISSWLLSYI
jgi:hypothetical protein